MTGTLFWDFANGFVSYRACQAACADAARDCYWRDGLVFGSIAAANAPPAIVECNTQASRCQSGCAIIAGCDMTFGASGYAEMRWRMPGYSGPYR